MKYPNPPTFTNPCFFGESALTPQHWTREISVPSSQDHDSECEVVAEVVTVVVTVVAEEVITTIKVQELDSQTCRIHLLLILTHHLSRRLRLSSVVLEDGHRRLWAVLATLAVLHLLHAVATMTINNLLHKATITAVTMAKRTATLKARISTATLLNQTSMVSRRTTTIMALLLLVKVILGDIIIIIEAAINPTTTTTAAATPPDAIMVMTVTDDVSAYMQLTCTVFGSRLRHCKDCFFLLSMD
jgi:hypothetical protein